MNPAPPRISLLPEHLIDQIKAGEVIERPGNLIKEILENALDAGATKLELTVKNNGLDLISLKDNGHGIFAADLPLAFSRHATSKINRFEDLYRLSSFGFRGEALASMAAICRLQCISFSQWETTGSEVRMEGGVISLVEKRSRTDGNCGTELVIKDLFFNTPVRLKFIQSQQAEKNFIRKIIFSFIISNPNVEFILKSEEEEKEIYPARETLAERLMDLIPKAKGTLKEITRHYEDNQIQLHLIPGHFRAPVKIQYVLINGRFVLDKQLYRVISNALIATFGNDEFHYVASLTLPAQNIDVNVHPNKTIIKIFEAPKVIGLMTASIKELVGNAPARAETNQEAKFNFSSDEMLPHFSNERQQYNLEGHFSPHSLPTENKMASHWIGTYLIRNRGEFWEVIHAKKLLSHFMTKKLTGPFISIPLLVSEPFKSSGLKNWERFIPSGLELEKLGPDTIVLRSIPDWMNGMPLRPVVDCLLSGKKLEDLDLNPTEWPDSSWDEMLQVLDLKELRALKITMDLRDLLEEKLK